MCPAYDSTGKPITVDRYSTGFLADEADPTHVMFEPHHSEALIGDRYAVDGQDTSGYRNVSEEYRTFAGTEGAPLANTVTPNEDSGEGSEDEGSEDEGSEDEGSEDEGSEDEGYEDLAFETEPASSAKHAEVKAPAKKAPAKATTR